MATVINKAELPNSLQAWLLLATTMPLKGQISPSSSKKKTKSLTRSVETSYQETKAKLHPNLRQYNNFPRSFQVPKSLRTQVFLLETLHLSWPPRSKPKDQWQIWQGRLICLVILSFLSKSLSSASLRSKNYSSPGNKPSNRALPCSTSSLQTISTPAQSWWCNK